MSTPPAHRRLVPRQPKKDPPTPPEDPEDLDVTAKHVVLEADPGDSLEIETFDNQEALADESLEMTIQRHVDVDDDDDESIDSVDEDVDAAETFAFQQMSEAAQFVAVAPQEWKTPETEQAASPLANLTVDQVSRWYDPRSKLEPDESSFAEFEPTNLKPTGSAAAGIEDRPMAHVSPAEIGLLAAMSEGHEPSRLKYVDWLERRGERARAEFLRLDHALVTISHDDPRHQWTRHRLRELAPKISVDWRSRVARSLIENCTAYGSGCPAYWRALPADSDDVRHCNACKNDVYYCVTIELARARVQNGQRVSIDVTCDRWVGDLDPHCPACQQPVPERTRYCPHCGHAM